MKLNADQTQITLNGYDSSENSYSKLQPSNWGFTHILLFLQMPNQHL
jgi:hypothetical protein